MVLHLCKFLLNDVRYAAREPRVVHQRMALLCKQKSRVTYGVTVRVMWGVGWRHPPPFYPCSTPALQRAGEALPWG